jgi:hypothetical protein
MKTSLSWRKPLLLAFTTVALSATALPASATIGSATIDVRSQGALGDGQHDDTSAFQAAINALPTTGGTVTVPAGRYMIDASRAIKMRSHTRLQMDPLAELDVIPNSLDRYWAIKVWYVTDVEIIGGSIVGDRAQHQGTTGEWGYGINITAASSVRLSDITVSNCWGDGLIISASGSGSTIKVSSNISLNRVVSTNNRRQGLSIAPSHDVLVVNSTFSNSNGTAPQAGIDIEPQTQGEVANVRLQVHDHVSGLIVSHNTLQDNHGYGVFTASPGTVAIDSNLITRNGLVGAAINGTSHDINVTNNALTYNSTRYIPVTATGKGGVGRDLHVSTTTVNVYIASNQLSP